jgi:tetratricopeptide (TPR) repeat protein
LRSEGATGLSPFEHTLKPATHAIRPRRLSLNFQRFVVFASNAGARFAPEPLSLLILAAVSFASITLNSLRATKMKRYLSISTFLLFLLSILLFPAACKKSKTEPSANLSVPTASPTPNIEAALSEITKSDKEEISKNPNDPANYYNLANTYFTAGKYADAIEQYQNAIRLDPKDASARYEIGQAYLRLNRYDEAFAAFNESLKINPKNAEVYHEMGNAYVRQDRTKEALAAYQKAVSLKPDHAEAYFNLGNLYSKLEQMPEAIKAFQQATRYNPKDSDAYFNLGNSYSRLKQFDAAINAYKEAVKLKPTDGEAHLRLAVLYLEQGNREAATVEYNTLKGMNPQLASMLNERMNQQK